MALLTIRPAFAAHLCSLALLASAVLPAHAAPDDAPPALVTTTVAVRHAKPSTVVAQLTNWNQRDAAREAPSSLLVVPGIQTLSADDTAHRIRASGTKDALQRLRDLVKLLDQPVPAVKLRAAITSAPYVPGDDSLPSTTSLVQSEVTVSNSDTVDVPLSADGVVVHASVRVHVNSDQSVSLAYTSDSRARGSILPAANGDSHLVTKSTARVKRGQIQRIPIGDPRLQTDATGAHRQFYLELTPVSVSNP